MACCDCEFSPTVYDVDGQMLVDWPDQRPRWVRMSTDLFDQLVAELNEARRKGA